MCVFHLRDRTPMEYQNPGPMKPNLGGPKRTRESIMREARIVKDLLAGRLRQCEIADKHGVAQSYVSKLKDKHGIGGRYQAATA
jgi:hypothetical protein